MEFIRCCLLFFLRCPWSRSTASAMSGMKLYMLGGYQQAHWKSNFYSPPRLHRPLITVPPALTGAAITVLALAEPFTAAGAAVAFIRCSLLFFKGPHGLVVPPRLGSFLLQKKD